MENNNNTYYNQNYKLNTGASPMPFTAAAANQAIPYAADSALSNWDLSNPTYNKRLNEIYEELKKQPQVELKTQEAAASGKEMPAQPAPANIALCSHLEDYPKIEGAAKSPEAVRTIKNLLAGVKGELSGVATYLFQHFLSNKPEYAEIGVAIKKILAEKARHVELLGNACVQFGGVPTYTNGRGLMWHGLFANMETNIKKFIMQNIAAEEESVANYSHAIKAVSNESLRRLFERIKKDKECHVSIMKGLFNKYFK